MSFQKSYWLVRQKLAPFRRSWRNLIKRWSLRRSGAVKSRKLIIFMVPGGEYISGGILSIFSLHNFSREMLDTHGAEVLMSFFPGEGWATWRYVMFDNDVTIYPFEMIMSACRRAEEILLHLPEYAAPAILESIGWDRLRALRLSHGLRVNILNQNNLMMPGEEFLSRLRDCLPEATCTTAHKRYTTREHRLAWGLPTHLLPAWTAPDESPATPFETKKDLMIVSPDQSPYRERVLKRIAAELPHIELKQISRMRYQDYLELEKSAKWSLTFGEGLDGYLLGVTLRGGLGLAVFNEDFFTPEYRGLRTVFPGYDALEGGVVEVIKSLDNKAAFEECNAAMRPILEATWSPKLTREALRNYYASNLTFR
jgi:hypothetical protein